MRSSIDALKRDVAEISAMAKSINPINRLLASSANPEIQAYLQVRRRFDYSSVIIALYASFERFVEDIVSSYIGVISKQDRYNSLPTKLIAKHIAKTAEIILKPKIDEARFPGVTVNKLVENLHQCLSGVHPYKLNHAAVTAHDKNIRYDELGILLGLVDIIHDDVCRARPLIEWYCNEKNLSGDRPTRVPTTVVKERLDGFVERRNDVAHRGGNPSDRLDAGGLQDLVEFMQSLSESIFTIFACKYLSKFYVDRSGCEELIRHAGPLRQQTVWIVDPPTMRLYIGQPVFAISDGFLVRWGRVQSLQIKQDVRHDVIPKGSERPGIGFDFRAPANSRIFVLEDEDELIWAPISL